MKIISAEEMFIDKGRVMPGEDCMREGSRCGCGVKGVARRKWAVRRGPVASAQLQMTV